MWTQEDYHFMHLALEEAKKAYQMQEVPVGAVVVYQGEVIAQAHNIVQKKKDALAHADCIALQKACIARGAKYLPSSTLYVTLEPCVMCAGACYWTQLGKLVFGTKDEKRGYQKWTPSLLHPKTIVLDGLLAQESKQLLQAFFQTLREK